jgi:hypothetical protein
LSKQRIALLHSVVTLNTQMLPESAMHGSWQGLRFGLPSDWRNDACAASPNCQIVTEAKGSSDLIDDISFY